MISNGFRLKRLRSLVAFDRGVTSFIQSRTDERTQIKQGSIYQHAPTKTHDTEDDEVEE